VFDVIVVGGGPAGLSGALMLGRCRRRVLVCDRGEPRNRTSLALHAFLTRDGTPPSQFTDLGRAELAAYGIAFQCVGVVDAHWRDDRFEVTLADGRTEQARFLLLATGVVDDLTLVPGLEACYGRSIFHCPYCDGWEWRDRRFAALGTGSELEGLALGLKTWTSDVMAFTHGASIPDRSRRRLERHGIAVHTGPIECLDHDHGRLRVVVVGGAGIARDVLFFASGQHPQSELAIKLGCTVTRRGTVKTDNRCGTNVQRVFVAGDASRDAQFVVVAAAEGAKAAVAINRAIQLEELAE
jgi:thioredoxin reductase